MCNTKRTVLIAMVICVAFTGVCSAVSKQPTVTELLGKYAETQDKLQNYSLKLHEDTDFKARLSGDWAHASGARKKHASDLIRTDGQRFYIESDRSGQVFVGSGVFPKDDPTHNIWAWDGVYYWSYRIGPKSLRKPDGRDFHGMVSVTKGATEEYIKGSINYHGGDKYLKGFSFIGIGRIDKVLKDTKKLSVRKPMVKVNGSKCYVINGATKYGRILLYIDPGHGYNIAKAKIIKKTGDIILGTKDKIMPGGDSNRTTLENVRFEKISGTWFPMEADTVAVVNSANGDFTQIKTHVKRTELILNPDHRDLGAFRPDLPDGAAVHFVNIEGIDVNKKYTWQDGAVIGADGKKIDIEKLVKKTKKLENKF